MGCHEDGIGPGEENLLKEFLRELGVWQVQHGHIYCIATMLNLTARIAVEIKKLPDWNIDWNDRAVLARHSDTDQLGHPAMVLSCMKKRATKQVFHILVEELHFLLHDPVQNLHQTFLHMGFLYSDVQHPVQFVDGHTLEVVATTVLVGSGCKNYATEAPHSQRYSTIDFLLPVPSHLFQHQW